MNLLCEYMRNPVGVDTPFPVLSWSVDDPSFRMVKTHISVFRGEGEILWEADSPAGVFRAVYAGSPLKSGRTFRWRAEMTGADGSVLTDESCFTTALLAPDQWKASWIGGIRIDCGCYLYRHGFRISQPLKSAAAFVASPCYNVLSVNGQPADDTLLNNVFADYEHSLYYRTYDITRLLHTGDNALGLMTGLGWHSLREAEDGIGWGDSLFSLQLLLEYTDGSEETLTPDADLWRFASDGPILYNSIYNGEIYDARREKTGWDLPEYDDRAWSDAVEREPPKGKILSQALEPIRVTRDMPVKEILSAPDGTWTLDFGTNFAGWIRIRIRGRAGDRIDLKFAEAVRSDGAADPTSLRNAHPVDSYILKGDGEEIWEPRFTYHGFRYAQVSGLKQKPEPGMFVGREVRTDAEQIGCFSCGHPVVQGFWNIMLQTERSNQHGVPTDCPQRDERLGWLNDMTVRNEGALYSFRLYGLYSKWLRDIRDTQGPVTGAITDTAPFLRYGFRPADPVSASFLLIPWNLYLHYGDSRPIRDNYEACARWVRYLLRNSRDGVVRYSSMGDWAAPVSGTDHTSTGGGALSVITPPLLMSTGYLYYDCTLMAKMAAVLGRETDRAGWLDQAEKVREAFNRAFRREDRTGYATGSQASNILPLYVGLTDAEDIPAVLKSLREDIVRNDGHLTTGNLCTRYAIEVLFRLGEADLAWQLLTRTEYPGWGFMLQNGATTVWERWEKMGDNDFMAAMAALNHPMNGGAVVSLYKHLAGISPDEKAPGWKHILFRPSIPAEAPGASASVCTFRGKVAFRWERTKDGIRWEAAVPDGSSATLFPPEGGIPFSLGPGITTGRF